MKKDIHPEVHEVQVRCVCGNTFPSTSTHARIEVGICSNCHPFFTGAHKFVDTAGRIDRFQQRYANASKAAPSAKKASKKK